MFRRLTTVWTWMGSFASFAHWIAWRVRCQVPGMPRMES